MDEPDPPPCRKGRKAHEWRISRIWKWSGSPPGKCRLYGCANCRTLKWVRPNGTRYLR